MNTVNRKTTHDIKNHISKVFPSSSLERSHQAKIKLRSN